MTLLAMKSWARCSPTRCIQSLIPPCRLLAYSKRGYQGFKQVINQVRVRLAIRPIRQRSSRLLWLPYLAFPKRQIDIRLMDTVAPKQASLAPPVRHLGLPPWYVVKFKCGASHLDFAPFFLRDRFDPGIGRIGKYSATKWCHKMFLRRTLWPHQNKQKFPWRTTSARVYVSHGRS